MCSAEEINLLYKGLEKYLHGKRILIFWVNCPFKELFYWLTCCRTGLFFFVVLIVPLHGQIVTEHHLPQSLAEIGQAGDVAVCGDVLETERQKQRVSVSPSQLLQSPTVSQWNKQQQKIFISKAACQQKEWEKYENGTKHRDLATKCMKTGQK